MIWLAVVLAALGAAAVVVGAALWFPPSALVVGGVFMLALAYGLAYAERRRS